MSANTEIYIAGKGTDQAQLSDKKTKPKNRPNGRSRVSATVIHAVLIIGSVFMLVPFIYMILGVFKTNRELLALPPKFWPEKFTLDNISYLLNERNFGKYFLNSIFLTLIKTAILLYTSTYIGYVLSKIDFKYNKQVLMFIISTMMIPFFLLMISLYDLMHAWHWINTYQSIIVVGSISNFGIFMMNQFCDGIPDSLLDSARIDGAKEFHIFHRIVIPNITASISALGIILFTGTWDDFLWPFLMLNKEELYTIPIGMSMFSGQWSTRYDYMLTASAIGVVPVIIVYIILQKQIVEGITLTGIKG